MLIRSQRTFALLLILCFLNLGIIGGLYYVELDNLLYWLTITVVFTFGILLVYYFKVFRPLGKIVEQVEALLTGEKYKKVFLPKNDEFGLLAKFFNSMTDNVESVSGQLAEGDRMTSELDLAADIQKSVLPKQVPRLKKMDVSAKTRPASEVGGDSFSFMKKNEEETYIYLGDVTGHGAPAGLIMMMVNTLLTVYLPTSNDTKEWAVKANEVLTPRVNSTMFMTTILLRWNSTIEKLFYTGAGHEHILIYRSAEGVCEAIPTGGIALGMTPDISQIAQEKEITLHKEDIVILYTDGIPEARNSEGEMYTLDRLKQAINKHGHIGDSQKLFALLAADLANFVGNEEQLDDITLLILRYTGASDSDNSASEQTSLLTTSWSLDK